MCMSAMVFTGMGTTVWGGSIENLLDFVYAMVLSMA
jgi:hypothetical protein